MMLAEDDERERLTVLTLLGEGGDGARAPLFTLGDYGGSREAMASVAAAASSVVTGNDDNDLECAPSCGPLDEPQDNYSIEAQKRRAHEGGGGGWRVLGTFAVWIVASCAMVVANETVAAQAMKNTASGGGDDTARVAEDDYAIIFLGRA